MGGRGGVIGGEVGPLAGALVPRRTVAVELRAAVPPKAGSTASLHLGTARTTARIDPIGAAPAGVAEPVGGGPDAAEARPVLARLRLHRPMVAIGGDRFVLRGSDVEGPAGAVLGGGVVLDARPPRTRPRGKRRGVLEAILAADAATAMRALVAEAAPRALSLDALASRFPLDAKDLGRSAERMVERGDIARVKARLVIERSALFAMAAKARALVIAHHRQAPLDRGLPRETLRRQLGDIAGPDVAEEAIRIAARSTPHVPGEPITVEADVARLPSFAAGAPPGALQGALDAGSRAVLAAGLKGVSEHAMREATGSSPKEVKALLAKLVREGLAFHAGELWFSRAAFEELRARVAAHLAAAPRLTIADFKSMSGLGRKQAIVLLEQLDREGTTRREGDDRLPGPQLKQG